MIFDLHNDYLTANADEKNACNALKSDCANCIIFAVWATKLGLDEFGYNSITCSLPKLKNVKSLFAIEDLGGLNIPNYDEFFMRNRPAYVSLTWNGENSLAGGVGSECGLTSKGTAALAAMSKYRVPLDVAHLNERSQLEAIDAFDGKLLSSHSGAYDALPSRRNLTSAQMRAIAARKGVIGIFAAADFIGSTRADYIRHLLTAIECVGAEHIAIGTDFYGTSNLPFGLKSYDDFNELNRELYRSGLSATEIDLIFTKNAENFFKRDE